MIPRYQRIVYFVLAAAVLVMTIVLIVSRLRDHERIAAMRDRSPIAAPTDIPNENVSIAQPNDADGGLALEEINLALSAEPSLRARVLLDRMLTDLSLPASTHPVPQGPALTDVFFLALPVRNPAAPISDGVYTPRPSYGMQLAVVNLTKPFADAHPSGVETEDLTLRAIIATLHANFPEIAQVRFLVEGAQRETLAGHADLTRAYAVSDPTKFIHVVVANE